MPTITADTDLLAAIADSDSKSVKKLLDSGVSPNSTGWFVDWLLRAKHSEDVKKEIDDGAPLDWQTMPALIAAAQLGDLEICRMLVEAGADVNVRDCGQAFNSKTPLIVAAIFGHLPVVELLAASGCDLLAADDQGCSATMHAVVAKHSEVASFLRTRVEQLPNSIGVAEAASHGSKFLVDKLLKDGASPDSVDGFGISALHYACKFNYEDIVESLLKAGADTKFGSELKSPKDARLKKHLETFAKYLDKPGAKNTIVSMAEKDMLDGQAPILIACVNGHVSVVKKLLSAGCDVNIASKRGKVTPLMMAVRGKHIDLITFLIESGADLHAKDASGATALDWAKYVWKLATYLPDGAKIVSLLESKLGPAAGPAKKQVDYKQVWKRFKETEGTEKFKNAIEVLSARCQAKPYPWKKKKGVQRFYVKNWDDLAEHYGKPPDYVKGAPKDEREVRKFEIACLLQVEVKALGFLLVSHKDTEGSAMQLLFPTLEKFEVIAACETDGENQGYVTEDIIERLTEIDAKYPFILTDCMHDAVGGRMVQPFKKEDELAKELCEFCSDLIDGDLVCSVGDVAKNIKKHGRFYLWWD